MTIVDVRREIESARAAAEAAGNNEVTARLDHVLHQLDGDLLLTTSEAARQLGIRSVNTIKAMVHAGQIAAHRVGTHYRIPWSEIERLRTDRSIHQLVLADRSHDQADMLGAPEGMTQEELAILAESRPGTVPWQRTATRHASGETGPDAADPDAVR